MSKPAYLILFILWAVLAYESLAVFDNESSSSIPHIRRKRMDHSLNQNHLGGNTTERHYWSRNLVNIKYPGRVEIVMDGNHIGAGFLIHSLFVITRPQYVQGPFNIRLYNGDPSEYPVGFGSPFIDINKDVAVVKVTKDISVFQPQHQALEDAGYTRAAIIHALEIVVDYMNYHKYEPIITGPSKIQAAAAKFDPLRLRRPMNQNQPRNQSQNVVDTVEPTRVEFITERYPYPPGFLINNYFIITRPSDVRTFKYIQLTMGKKSIMKAGGDGKYVNQNFDVAVVKIEPMISLVNPEYNAFHYRDYSKAAIDHAVGVVRNWMEGHGHTIELRGPRRPGHSGASGSGSG